MAEHFASVSFTASASLSAAAVRSTPAAVTFPVTASLAAAATREVSWASVTFTARATLTATITPRGTKRRAVVTDAFGQAFGELENAKIGTLT